MMLGSGAIQAPQQAIADAMALLKLLADPAAAKANLEAWTAAQEAGIAAHAGLDDRAKELDAREATLGSAIESHQQAVRQHYQAADELEAAKKDHAEVRQQFAIEQDKAAQALAARDAQHKQREFDASAKELAQKNAAADLDVRQRSLDLFEQQLKEREAAIVAGEDALAKKLEGARSWLRL
jgi:hypothetical protein